jgi:tetratricopeptide (TPR) repeat protein
VLCSRSHIRASCLAGAIAFLLSSIAYSQERVGASVLAPARTGLEPVGLPSLDQLEATVADHLREARRAFEQAARSGRTGDLADAYGTLGRVLHAYEFFDAAEACYHNATRVRPTDATWLHLRGYLYQQSGRFDEAIDVYLGARRAAPDDHAVTVHLGEAFLAIGRNTEAQAAFQSTLERFPAVSNAGLGEVALRQGRYKDAVRHFEAALQRIPSATALEYSLAMAYRGLGRLDDARAHLTRRGSGGVRVSDPIVDGLQALMRGERAFVLQGRRAYDAGQYQQAADAFGKAVAAAPSSVTPHVNLALALAQLGNVDGAVEQFDAALRLDADNVDAHTGLGTLLARLGRDREAVDHLRAAFRQAPDDARVSAALISALLKLSLEDEAIDVVTHAPAFHTDDEDVLLRVSVALAARERYRDALMVLEDGHRTFPDRPSIATTLARLLAASPDVSLRDGQRALDLAMFVYMRTPLPVYAETVAIALAELGRCDEAADWMRQAIAGADGSKDAAEGVRLRREAGRYNQRPCRP